MGYLNDKVTTFMMSGKDQEMQQLKIEGDLVTSFFDSVNMLDDSILFAFIEDVKKDIDLILHILSNSTNEMVVFFTYLLVLLKKLNPQDSSFINTVHMCKSLVQQINDAENQSSVSNNKDFNKFFINHLLRNYCSIIIQSPNKRQFICELIYSHCAHDLQMRIKVV